MGTTQTTFQRWALRISGVMAGVGVVSVSLKVLMD